MWKERYRVGVTAIDKQHRELFNRLSSFIETVMVDESMKEKMASVRETLYFLEEYCEEHFTTEEAYQARIDFPDYDRHSKEHKDFAKEIASYRRRLDRNLLTKKDLKKLSARFMTWLIMHVGYEDQQIGKYARE